MEDNKKPVSRSMAGKASNEIASEKHHEIKNKEKKDSNDGVKVSDARVSYLKETNEQILNQNTTKLKNSGENFDQIKKTLDKNPINNNNINLN